MTPEQFMQNFGVIAETPKGIAKLRAEILSLGTSGRLNTGDHGDHDAIDLLPLVAAEREGTLGKKQIARVVFEAAVPFELPANWVWASADEVFVSIADGDHQPPPKTESGVPFLVIGNVSGGRISFVDTRYVSSVYYEALDPIRTPRRGDILYTLVGSYGIPVLVEDDRQFCIQRHMAVLRPPKTLDTRYLLHLLSSGFVYSQVTETATGTAQKTVPLRGLRRIALPIPPLAEQKRIVAKVDQLMSMLDDLEQRQEEKRTAGIHVSKASLDSLVNAEDPDQLARAWERVSKNFGLLGQSQSGGKMLRGAVLSLAVQGKLGSGEDSPIGKSPQAILARVEAQRMKLKANGELLEKVAVAPLTGDPPIKLPGSWTWTPLEAVCTHIADCLHRTPQYSECGFPAIRTSDMRPGRILVEQARRVSEAEYIEQTRRLTPRPGDIFYSREGNFGIAAVVPHDAQICLSQRMMQFRVGDGVIPEYFAWAMNSPLIFSQASRDALGMTVPHVNIRSLRRFWFPLPPEEEQRRIVRMIEKLFQLVDRLEQCVAATTEAASGLADLLSAERGSEGDDGSEK